MASLGFLLAVWRHRRARFSDVHGIVATMVILGVGLSMVRLVVALSNNLPYTVFFGSNPPSIPLPRGWILELGLPSASRGLSLSIISHAPAGSICLVHWVCLTPSFSSGVQILLVVLHIWVSNNLFRPDQGSPSEAPR